MKLGQIRQSKAIHKENTRLQKPVAGQELDIAIIKEALSGHRKRPQNGITKLGNERKVIAELYL